MMTQYRFTLDLPSADEVSKIVNSAVLPKVTQAVQAIANQAKTNWQRAVYDAKLWSGEKNPYIASITMQMTGPFSAVVSSDYRYAEEIETGRPARDLKRMLDTSPKVRRTLDGRRFLIIPMRHNTTGSDAHAPAMPEAIGQMAANLKHSAVTGASQRPAGQLTILSAKTGMSTAKKQTSFLSSHGSQSAYLVNQSHYQWGERIMPSMLRDQSKADRRKYGGMVRMKESTGGSTYMTFRVMMEGSSGWFVPARPGLFLAKNVVNALQPLAEAAIREAFKQSVP